MLKSFSILIILLFIPSLALAETLHLKNGKVVIGQVIKETDYSIQLKVNSIPFTYYKEEIEYIDNGETPLDVIDKAVKEEIKKEDIKQDIKEDKAAVRKRELITRLLDVNGARDAMSRIFLQIIDQAPKENQDDLRSMLKVDRVIEQLVPIYEKNYEETEITELINFYTSPTGKKNLQLIPQIMQESLEVATKYFKELTEAVEKKEKDEKSATK